VVPVSTKYKDTSQLLEVSTLATRTDFIIAVVCAGTVYNVVKFVLDKTAL
jgi:hypothetical protein